MKHYFIRIGALSEIRLASALIPLQRGRRVVVRSPRGVELAEIVAPVSERVGPSSGPRRDGTSFRIVRPTTQSDEMLIQRLEKYKRQAVLACRERLRHAGSGTILLDVDQLLDGGTLVLHFLGEADSSAQAIANEVAREYESIVRTRHLSELLAGGCGPECGTTAGAGCGSGSGCAGCSGCGD